jgi:predicted RNA-binding Zn ribbon-like protein
MTVSSENPSKLPHELDLVIEFVNSRELDLDLDEFAQPAGLAAWLIERRLMDRDDPPLREPQRRQAVSLREALRTLMHEHNGFESVAAASAELDRVAASGQLSVHFDADGSARLAPRASGFAGVLAKLLVPVAASQADGSWQRVKACRADDCQWAFYDSSRNRSGVWCDMAVCGNRTKVRTYRSRHT